MEERKPESSERLNEYIRIGKPGIILLIISLVLVFGAILVWGFTGKLYETISLSGIVDRKDAVDVRCFVDADSMDGHNLEGREVTAESVDALETRMCLRSSQKKST